MSGALLLMSPKAEALQLEMEPVALYRPPPNPQKWKQTNKYVFNVKTFSIFASSCSISNRSNSS